MSGIREIIVPALGESVTEASVVKWLKSAGQAVTVDEILLEIETDKITLEVTAPITGVLEEIIAGNGATVAVGGLLGLIRMGAEKPAIVSSKDTITSSKPSEQDVFLSPAARKAVADNHLDPSQILGTGKEERITKEDVFLAFEKETIPKDKEYFKEQKKEISPELKPEPKEFFPESKPELKEFFIAEVSDLPSLARREERVRMTQLRKKIAERLKYAQNTAAILTSFNEVDMGNIQAFRARYKESFAKKHGIKLGLMSFVVKASIAALKEIPIVNSEIDGDEIIYKNFFDIGVAVSAPQGLVVPVIRDADQLSFAGIETRLAALSDKAREGKLSMDDLKGGTFTISNGGVFGSLLATPILNPPQSAILGMHKIQERAVVIDGKIEIRPMMYAALSYDHRIIDGREAVTFLVRVKELLENPERLLLDL